MQVMWAGMRRLLVRGLWQKRGIALAGIVTLEALTAIVDRSVPQDVPTSHLYYLPIILAAVARGSWVSESSVIT